jgi:hypothetical protein
MHSTLLLRLLNPGKLKRLLFLSQQEAHIMANSIELFVSSSPELVAEREALGQAVAELPIALGWVIKHTACAGQNIEEGLAFIEHCDLFLIILGGDFAAPMGLEWEQALQNTVPVVAYRKDVLHSPSAQRLLRQSVVSWNEFSSTSELKAHFSYTLARHVLDRSVKFGLEIEDIQGLMAMAELPEEESPAEKDQREGAGAGGIILGRDR